MLNAIAVVVQSEIYKLYGKAYGWYSLLALCFFWASEQSCNILTSWWLSQWTTAQILYQVRRAQGRLLAIRLLPGITFPCAEVMARVSGICMGVAELLVQQHS